MKVVCRRVSWGWFKRGGNHHNMQMVKHNDKSDDLPSARGTAMQNRIQDNLRISRIGKNRKAISRYRCYHVRIIGDDDMTQTTHIMVLRRGWKTPAIGYGKRK